MRTGTKIGLMVVGAGALVIAEAFKRKAEAAQETDTDPYSQCPDFEGLGFRADVLGYMNDCQEAQIASAREQIPTQAPKADYV